MGVEAKNRGFSTPKMDGENNGKPYFLNGMIWGYSTPIFGNTHISYESYLSIYKIDFYKYTKQL